MDIRTIQLMLGHADMKQTQRYLNITDEELRKAMTGVWERRRQLKAVGQYPAPPRLRRAKGGPVSEHEPLPIVHGLSMDCPWTLRKMARPGGFDKSC